MVIDPKELLRQKEPLKDVIELNFDSIMPGDTVTIRTNGSVFVLETTHRSEFGTLFGKVTRFSEVPMTAEGSRTYLPDVMIIQEECQLFMGQTIRMGEQMYFHGIHYDGRTYKDEGYDVIHTAPIEAISIQDEAAAA